VKEKKRAHNSLFSSWKNGIGVKFLCIETLKLKETSLIMLRITTASIIGIVLIVGTKS